MYKRTFELAISGRCRASQSGHACPVVTALRLVKLGRIKYSYSDEYLKIEVPARFMWWNAKAKKHMAACAAASVTRNSLLSLYQI